MLSSTDWLHILQEKILDDFRGRWVHANTQQRYERQMVLNYHRQECLDIIEDEIIKNKNHLSFSEAMLLAKQISAVLREYHNYSGIKYYD